MLFACVLHTSHSFRSTSPSPAKSKTRSHSDSKNKTKNKDVEDIPSSTHDSNQASSPSNDSVSKPTSIPSNPKSPESPNSPRSPKTFSRERYHDDSLKPLHPHSHETRKNAAMMELSTVLTKAHAITKFQRNAKNRPRSRGQSPSSPSQSPLSPSSSPSSPKLQPQSHQLSSSTSSHEQEMATTATESPASSRSKSPRVKTISARDQQAKIDGDKTDEADEKIKDAGKTDANEEDDEFGGEDQIMMAAVRQTAPTFNDEEIDVEIDVGDISSKSNNQPEMETSTTKVDEEKQVMEKMKQKKHKKEKVVKNKEDTIVEQNAQEQTEE